MFVLLYALPADHRAFIVALPIPFWINYFILNKIYPEKISNSKIMGCFT
jgi:hypothetical protein